MPGFASPEELLALRTPLPPPYGCADVAADESKTKLKRDISLRYITLRPAWTLWRKASKADIPFPAHKQAKS